MTQPTVQQQPTTSQPTAAQINAGSVVVAVVLLLLLGTILSIGAVRYDEGDLAKLVGALGPILGVISGAFVTYFFSRSAVQTSADTAQKASDTAQQAQAATQQAQARSKTLHNALTDVFSALPDDQSNRMRQRPAVTEALGAVGPTS